MNTQSTKYTLVIVAMLIFVAASLTTCVDKIKTWAKKAEEGKSFFIETSALQNINVQDTFKIVGIGLFFKHIEQVEET